MTITTALDDVYKEIDIMKQLSHSNIVSLFELIDDPSSDKLYLIMPLADYGESMSFDSQRLEFRPNHKL
jgi:serine/threonine protein kinase